MHLLVATINPQSKRGLQQHEECAGRPGLGLARDRVGGRTLPGRAGESAVELRQAHREMVGCFEDVVEKRDDAARAKVPGYACDAERRIVRPDRAIVIGHRVEARFAFGQRPDAPTRAKLSRQKLLRYLCRTLRARQAEKKQMAGIRRPHTAWMLIIPVHGDGVEVEIGDPEASLDLHGQPFSACPPSRRLLMQPALFSQSRDGPQCGTGIGLDLDHGNRSTRQATVGMKYGVLTVLPSLIHQAGIGGPGVVQKAAGAAFQALFDPGDRRDEVVPDLIDQRGVGGTLFVGAGEYHEQRRRVDPAVVLAERDFMQDRHLSPAHLVQDLAGLRIPESRFLVSLGQSQEAQYTGRQVRIDPQGLERSDDRIPAELRGKPGDARVRIGSCRQGSGEKRKVRSRLVKPLVEEAPRAGDRGTLPDTVAHAASQVALPIGEAPRRRPGIGGGTDFDVQLDHGLARNVEREAGFAAVDRYRGFGEVNLGRAQALVEAHVGKAHKVRTYFRLAERTPPRPLATLYLEDIDKVGTEIEGEWHDRMLATVIREAQPLVDTTIAQEACPLDVDDTLRNRDL